jgi:hypothetical protein
MIITHLANVLHTCVCVVWPWHKRTMFSTFYSDTSGPVSIEGMDPDLTRRLNDLFYTEPLSWDREAELEFYARAVWDFGSDSLAGQPSRYPMFFDTDPLPGFEDVVYESSLLPLIKRFPAIITHDMAVAVKIIRKRELNKKLPKQYPTRRLLSQYVDGHCGFEWAKVMILVDKYKTVIEFAREIIAPLGVMVLRPYFSALQEIFQTHKRPFPLLHLQVLE